MLITPEEMIEITGYKYAKRQKQVLNRERVPYTCDVYGRPKTTWDAYNTALMGATKQDNNDGFNLDGI